MSHQPHGPASVPTLDREHGPEMGPLAPLRRVRDPPGIAFGVECRCRHREASHHGVTGFEDTPDGVLIAGDGRCLDSEPASPMIATATDIRNRIYIDITTPIAVAAAGSTSQAVDDGRQRGRMSRPRDAGPPIHDPMHRVTINRPPADAAPRHGEPFGRRDERLDNRVTSYLAIEVGRLTLLGPSIAPGGVPVHRD